MATEVYSSAYILELKFPQILNRETSKAYTTKDILQLYIMRTPMVKLANVTIALVPIPIITFMEVESKINNKDFINVTIDFGIIEFDAVSKNRNYESTLVKSNDYVIISIKSMQEITLINKIPLIKITMVNKICFELSKTHLFNQVFSKYDEVDNTTFAYGSTYGPNEYYKADKMLYNPKFKIGKDIIDMDSQFKDETGILNRIADRYMASLLEYYGKFSVILAFEFDYESLYNNYDYEQILVHCNSDLQVLKFLWNKYKWIKSPGYVLFDDFSTSPLARSHDVSIRLGTFARNGGLIVDELPSIDIRRYQELIIGTRIINREPYNDVHDKLNFSATDTSHTKYIIETPDDTIYSNEDSVDNDLFISTVTDINEVNVGNDDRLGGSAVNKTRADVLLDQKNPRKVPQQTIKLKTPDNRSNAIDRITQANNISSNKIKSIVTFESTSVHYSLIDFNTVYNLDRLSLDSFIYEPISIINMFTKVDNRDIKMKHSVKYQCLEHSDEE